MTRRFVMMVDGLSAAQDQQLAKALAPPLGWWHQMPNVWLVVDHTNIENVISLRARVEAINQIARCVVLQVSNYTWATRLFTEANNSTMSWLRANWEGPSDA